LATRSVEELDLRGRRVFLRVDFNVPLDATGRIQDDARIRAALPTICLALERGARLIVASHLGRPKGPTPSASLRPVAARLSELVDRPVPLAPDCIGPTVSDQIRALEPGDLHCFCPSLEVAVDQFGELLGRGRCRGRALRD